MITNPAAKHNRLFQTALAIVKEEVPLGPRKDMPRPDWFLGLRLKRAIRLFERVLAINPENWPAMWFIGKVQQRLGNMTDALSWFERCCRINPGRSDAAREASICAMEIGRCDIAIFFAERATQIDSDDGGLHANLALAHLLAARIPDAKATINRALMLTPSDELAQNIKRMIGHFSARGTVPPSTIPALLNYWRACGDDAPATE